MSRLWRSRYNVLFILLISSVVFIGLGRSSLRDYDEGIHAEVSREIIQTNDWLTLQYGGTPRFEKPPLYNWTTAVFFNLFGINEFWARAGSAFSSVLVAFLTYILGSTVYNPRVGLLAMVPLFAGYEFLRQARNGATDVMLTLFMLLVLIAYIRYSGKNVLSWYLFWSSFALGFMVKFWAIVLVLIPVGINMILEKNLKATLRSKHFWGGILVALVLILPWHLAMYQLYGQEFVDRYIIHNLWARSSNALEGNIGTARYYFDRMAYDYAPWFFLLPVALMMELRRLSRNRDKTSTLLIFIVCLFGIYSLFVSTKLFHYLTPLYPLLAIFNANVLLSAYDDYHSTAFHGLIVAALIATITPSLRLVSAFVVLAAFLVGVLFLVRRVSLWIKSSLEAKKQEQRGEFKLDAGRILGVLSWLGRFTERKNIPKLIVVLICMFFTVIGMSKSRQLYMPVESPVEQIARLAGTSNTLQDDAIIALAIGPDYEQAIVGPAAMFYSERPIKVAWVTEELALFTSQGPREIIMGEDYIDVLANEYEITALVRRSPFVYGIIQQRNRVEAREE